MTDRIYQAIEEGGAPRDLALRHAERAKNLCEQPDGSFTFQIERHPHVLGHPSKGSRSSFFETQLVTYRWSAGEITEEDVSSKGFTIDEWAVKFEVEDVLSSFREYRQLVAECDTEEEASQTAGDLAKLHWIDDEWDGLPREFIERYRRLCEGFAREALMEAWRENETVRLLPPGDTRLARDRNVETRRETPSDGCRS